MRFIIAALFVVLACVHFPAIAQGNKVREATPKEIALIKKAMQDQLRDPDSAKYSMVVVKTKSEGDGVYITCGLVNSKNGYGGYAGNAWFMGVFVTLTNGNKEAMIISVDSSDPENGEVAAKMCAEKLEL